MPNRKVGAGALSGAVAVLLIWIADAFGGVKIPAEQGAGLTTILTFMVSYFVTE